MERLLGPDPAADRFLAPRSAPAGRGRWRTAATAAAAAAAAAMLAVLGTTLVLQPHLGVGGDPTAGGPPWGGSSLVSYRRSSSSRTVHGHDMDCGAAAFTMTTLKLVTEQPVVRLITDRPPDGSKQLPIAKFEASDVAGVAGGSHVYVVFDNSFKIGHLSSGLTYRTDTGPGAESNYLLTWPDDDGSDSQFEAITLNATAGTYLVIQESVVNASGHMVPRILEVSLDGGAATVHASCDGQVTFASENKGFEGAAVATAADGTSYLLALCEGNYCDGGKAGRKPGHGRLLVLERVNTPPAIGDSGGGRCAWVPRQVVPIPPAARFMDYSAISIYANRRVAISSQENAAVWVGELELLDGAAVEGGADHARSLFGRHQPVDPHTPQRALFGLSSGRVYDFPRNALCERIYCTVEGVHWQEADMLVAVSDKMKGGGKQPFVCMEHDQSVHTFLVPR